MEKRDCIKRIRGYFEGQDDVSVAYLFGSTVKGKATKNSDIDIAILFAQSLSLLYRFERKLEIANDLEDILKKKVDVIDLENADLYFIHQVMLSKEIVLDRDIERRVTFEVEKRRNYFDMKHFYDLYHRQALKRLEEKGRQYKKWSNERQ